jgi:drug/metabolite transporter (DMT)-like permease
MPASIKIAPSQRDRRKWLIHFAAFVTVAIWGVSFVSTKVLLDNGMGAVEIYIYRFVIAYLLVLAISHKQFRAHSWRDEGMFALCGICAGSIYFIAENTALEYTLASNVSLLTALSPLITALLIGFFYKGENPTWGMLVSSLVAFAGAACIIFNSSSTLEVHPIGDILSIAAAFSWAFYSLILRNVNANYDAWFVTRKTFFYGVLSALPFLLFSPSLNNPIVMLSKPEVITNVLFLGVLASLVAYILWSNSVKYLGPVTANNYMYLQPIVTMVASAILINEKITVMGVVGCALIIGGLVIGDRVSPRKEAGH